MNPRNLLITLSLIILALLIWQLRWVLLVLFGAVVVAVALDVLIDQLQSRSRLQVLLSLRGHRLQVISQDRRMQPPAQPCLVGWRGAGESSALRTLK